MKKLIAATFFLALLTACGSSSVNIETDGSGTVTTGKVPTNCELENVNAAFAKIIPPSEYIPTDWMPAEGTDLYAALNNGGIACTYGDEAAEVGGTVIWALATDALWQELVTKWESEGLEKVDIPSVDEVAAYKLPDGSTSVDGMPTWRVNLLMNGVWIQLEAAFIQSYDEATPIIEAAIDSAK